MSRAASTSLQVSADTAAAHPGDLTQVDLTWIDGDVEQWLRFGTPTAERRIDHCRRVLSFAHDVTFALVRWASNGIGTVLSRLDVVRTVAPGTALQTLPLVRPGGEALLTVSGWQRVERVLGHIDAIEAAGIDPADVDLDHWRHVHHRMAASQRPSDYTAARHHAAVMRRRIGA